MKDQKFSTPLVQVTFFYDQTQNLLIAKGSDAHKLRQTIFADEALVLTDLNIKACREIGSTPRIVYGIPDSFQECVAEVELSCVSSEIYDSIKSFNPTA